jgi:DNA/RNA-binding domain of Phe-tRNA-synthetase-like protein
MTDAPHHLESAGGLAIDLDDHPLLDAAFVIVEWHDLRPDAVAELAPWIPTEAGPPPDLGTPEASRKAQIRDLFRHGGFKPNGRNKPCNEYITKVAAQGSFPRISPIVDWTNAGVFHTSLPISTIDLDRGRGPFHVGVAEPGQRYVFNASGQELDLSGLLCLFDVDGPCANAVKDSQRTKTHDGTKRTLTVVWGTVAWPGRAATAAGWLRERAEALGGRPH